MFQKPIASAEDWLVSRDPFRMLQFLGKDVSERKLRLFACACCRRLWHVIDDDAGRKAVEVAELFADGQIGEAERKAAREAALTVALRERDLFGPAGHLANATTMAVSRGTELIWDRFTGVIISAGPGKWQENAFRCTGEGTSYCDPAYHSATVALCCSDAANWEAARQRLAEWQGRPIHQRLWRYAKILVTSWFSGHNWSMRFANSEEFYQPIWREHAAQADLLRDVFGNPCHPCTLDSALPTGEISAMAGSIYRERRFNELPLLGHALQDAGCKSEAILRHCFDRQTHVRGCWLLDALLQPRQSRG